MKFERKQSWTYTYHLRFISEGVENILQDANVIPKLFSYD
jgi:hypothetical protein